MNKKRLVLGACLLLVLVDGAEARRGGYVHGYTRRDGTHVNGYYRGGGSSSSSSSYSPTFSSCAAARASGYSNMTTGSPGYSSSLDRDGDGIACESGSGSGSGGSTGYSPSSPSYGSSATPRPPGAAQKVLYFRAKDLIDFGGAINKISASTYEITAYNHHVNVIPNSLVILVDNKQTRVAAPPVIYEGNLYIPAQFLFKMGCNIKNADSYSIMADCPNYSAFISFNTAIW